MLKGQGHEIITDSKWYGLTGLASPADNHNILNFTLNSILYRNFLSCWR